MKLEDEIESTEDDLVKSAGMLALQDEDSDAEAEVAYDEWYAS